jgi:hypothetical protein
VNQRIKSNQTPKQVKIPLKADRYTRGAVKEIRQKTNDKCLDWPDWTDAVLAIDRDLKRMGQDKSSLSVRPGDLVDSCIQFEDVDLYPLSVGNRLWVFERALHEFKGDEVLQWSCVAFAMSQKGVALEHVLTNPRLIRREVKKFAKSLSSTSLTEIKRAVDLVTEKNSDHGESDKDRPSSPVSDAEAACRKMVERFGHDVHYWMFEVSEKYMGALWFGLSEEEAEKEVSDAADNITVPGWTEHRRLVDSIIDKVNAWELE